MLHKMWNEQIHFIITKLKKILQRKKVFLYLNRQQQDASQFAKKDFRRLQESVWMGKKREKKKLKWFHLRKTQLTSNKQCVDVDNNI